MAVQPTSTLSLGTFRTLKPAKVFGLLAANWKSGLTVALVSLPLSVSLAIASGANPNVGIITAIWAGFVAALLGGSHFNIVGPAGALSGILAAYSLQHGAAALPTLAIASGVVILLAWVLKAERFLVFVPASTMQGFTLAVGIVIGLGQLNSAFGIIPAAKHAEFILNTWESLRQLPNASLLTAGVFFVSLGLLFAMLKINRRIPGAIVLAPLGILVGWLMTTGVLPGANEVATLATKYGNISSAIVVPIHLQFSSSLVTAAFSVAVVAILETMLTARIADDLTKTRHNPRRELFGLAVANMASGAVGGLPATGVLVRTSLNAKSGATHRTSAIVNTVCLAIISAALLPFFRYIPMAVIAAILVFASIRMVEVHEFKKMWATNRTSFWLGMAVAAVTVIWDPIYGISFGVAASSLIMMERMSKAQCEVWVKKGDEAAVYDHTKTQELAADGTTDVLTYAIRGQLVYLNGQAHLARFENGLSEFAHVVLNLKGLHHMDDDGAAALQEILERCAESGCEVVISGASKEIESQLDRLVPAYAAIKQHGKAVASVGEALKLAHA